MLKLRINRSIAQHVVSRRNNDQQFTPHGVYSQIVDPKSHQMMVHNHHIFHIFRTKSNRVHSHAKQIINMTSVGVQGQIIDSQVAYDDINRCTRIDKQLTFHGVVKLLTNSLHLSYEFLIAFVKVYEQCAFSMFGNSPLSFVVSISIQGLWWRVLVFIS